MVIKTPKSLIPSHLVDRPIDEWKAATLSANRGRLQKVRPTTVFEDPEIFYLYPDLELMVSEEEVTKYRAVPEKPKQEEKGQNVPIRLNVNDHGKQFAVFEARYHLHNEGDRELSQPRRRTFPLVSYNFTYPEDE